ncbi:hypothetical protein [Endozoicomonas sp. SESOKO4]|uniref:hypothetical protein n=1 Tax=Endozoicomonas sp. SESOKO4 TaxID=2828745 RepID=UPI002148724E|nr:hypothetical protein [Endozoicomonas sp. SESOKO4]
MNKNLIKDQNRQSLIINKKPPALILSLVVCFPNWNNWASTIGLDNNNFNQYLNADHPVEGRYRLMSDIELSRFIPWKPVGNTSNPFSVILLGNGHVISGLEVSTLSDNTPSGLFGSLQNSTIRQILFKQPKVTSYGNTSPAGALVGMLKRSRIEEVVNYAGTIKTTGFRSHAGGIAGSVSDSVIHDSVNTGTVFTTGSASTGGIAGLGDQISSLSNDLNTGKIVSRNLHSSPAGGIVGTLKSDSIANNNLNTGEVNVGFTEYSGGVVGKAEAAKALYNLNTGKIASDYSRAFCRLGGSSGGIVGHASRQSLVSKNLNTGSIFTRDWRTYGGGIAGDVVNTTVVQNVNAGTVTTHDFQSSAGGITGEAEGSGIRDNLNVGAIMTKDAGGHLGAITGAATLSTSVYNNVNTGSVEARDSHCYVSGVAGRVWKAGAIEHNLDTFTKYQWTSERGSGRNIGIIRLSKSTLKSNVTLLDSTLWNAGDASQLPMLKGINTPYRELARINGTKQTNNQFPSALNEFADPGGAANATSFDRTVWNSRDGSLPFLNVFSKPQTLLAGIDCTKGGFDCSEDKTPSAMQPYETHSPSLPANCPPPEGTPLFQAYDPANQQVYVVIQPESFSKEIILARYKGRELDKQFGLCGIVTYTTSTKHSGMLASYQSLTGQVVYETEGSQLGSSLNIVAMSKSGKATLFEFPLSDIQRYRARFSVIKNVFPENIQINDIAHHQDAMYLTGKINNSLFIGRYHQRKFFFSEKYSANFGQYDEQQGLNLKLSPDGERLYVIGKSDDDVPYPLFIRQYDSQQLTPVASFGNNGREAMTINDFDTINSQQDILIQKDQIYVAVFSPEREKLSIRRFATDNGQIDSAFIIDDKIDFSPLTPGSFVTVRLMITGDHLHAIIYNSDGQLSVFTYKDQVKVHRFDTTFKPATAESMRLVFLGNKAYLAVEVADIEEGSRQVRMQEVFLGLENLSPQEFPATLSSGVNTRFITGFFAGCTLLLGTVAFYELAKSWFKKELIQQDVETQ